MKTLIQKAKNEVIKDNNEFDYSAGDLEVAASIWHNYLNPLQRLEIMKNNNISKSVNECYKAIVRMF